MEQAITVFHKDENLEQKEVVIPKKPKRGPLSIPEQLTLIEICRKHAKYTAITSYTKNFWVHIEIELEREIGRRYSHYSCRRRITDFISLRRSYRQMVELGLNPHYHDMPEQVCSLLDDWMNENDLEELDKQIKKQKAIAQLKIDTHVSQSAKIQRVLDWIKNVPDPEPQSAPSRPPSPPGLALQLLASQNVGSSRYHASELSTHDIVKPAYRPATSMGRDKLPIKQEPSSPAHKQEPLLPPSQPKPPSTPQDPYNSMIGKKRPREDHEFVPDRSAQRLRTSQIGLALNKPSPLKEQLPGVVPENTQSTTDTIFNKFWEIMLPYFTERAIKEGPSIAKSESIMHDLFKEVGSALTRAFVKLEQGGRRP
ncbi:hypothetical protein ARAM_005727 [Aspergillus rambellii]|uniref:Uncharacterized protein n=1 Tax=Aspergillus rambellii TaxID=308745 RepID=A0A0F8UFW1_9EURO|nr:hypothetical protein ARAM_005727 [Aspergillus rambellii]